MVNDFQFDQVFQSSLKPKNERKQMRPKSVIGPRDPCIRKLR